MSDEPDRVQALLNHEPQAVSAFLEPGEYDAHDWRFGAALGYFKYGDASSGGEILSRAARLFVDVGRGDELKSQVASQSFNDVLVANVLVGLSGCEQEEPWILAQIEAGRPAKALGRYQVARALAQTVLRAGKKADARLLAAIANIVNMETKDWPNATLAAKLQTNLKEMAKRLS